MSTAMLRVKLFNLEKDLADLSVQHSNIYDAYIDMLHVINSVPRNKVIWIINLVATLSFQSWNSLSESQKKCFTDALGKNFIDEFNKNELITILLQANESKLILTSMYLYPLLKMLFTVLDSVN